MFETLLKCLEFEWESMEKYKHQAAIAIMVFNEF